MLPTLTLSLSIPTTSINTLIIRYLLSVWSVLLSACLPNSHYLGSVKLVLVVNSGTKEIGAGSSGEKETVKFTMDVHQASVSDHLHVIYLV